MNVHSVLLHGELKSKIAAIDRFRRKGCESVSAQRDSLQLNSIEVISLT